MRANVIENRICRGVVSGDVANLCGSPISVALRIKSVVLRMRLSVVTVRRLIVGL